jgi:hypothetical protein
VQVPGVLRNTNESPIWRCEHPIFPCSQRDAHVFRSAYDISTIIFSILWVGFLFFILYNFFLSCFRRNDASRAPRPPPTHRPSNSGGWFPGGMGGMDDSMPQPPPPYSKNPTEPANQGWRPGFWTGAALGGAATHLFGNRRQAQPASTPYDWERVSFFSARPASYAPAEPRFDNRGEGSSNLGAMRRSTGLGGSNVR